MTEPLSIAIGDNPHVAALKSGAVSTPGLELRPVEIKPISRAFAPMVREARFDVSEIAIATFLQAKAYGKPLVLLPIVLGARYQEASLLCRRDSDIAGPADLAGRRIGVRAYSQTTGMWLRGIMADDHGLRPEDMRWVTFEDAHVAEYRDPPWAERAAPGQDMLAMLRAGELDAAIVGNDAPGDPGLRPVFPDPVGAGEAFRRKHGFAPPNHLVAVRAEIAEGRPEIAATLVRLFRTAAEQAPPSGFTVSQTRADLDPAIRLAVRFCREQGLVPADLSPDQVWQGLPRGVGDF